MVTARSLLSKNGSRAEVSMDKQDSLWQCRDIRFDVDQRMLRMIPGEVTIDKLENVEDTKGNLGDRGVMRITNLRLIWHANGVQRINLSIGLTCISGLRSKQVQSKVRGSECEALYVMAKLRESTTRFEFIFTSMTAGQHTRLFNTLASVVRAYETTKLYRELKMRGAIIDDNDHLKLLPQEQLCERVAGVWNLSQDQGNLGVFVITNIRIVWYAEMNPLYNVSVPYLQLFSCRIRDSKFGHALVLETSATHGTMEYVLGFRIDPPEKLAAISKMVSALNKALIQKPIFGVTVRRDRPPTPRGAEGDAAIDHLEDDVEVDEKPLRTDAFAAYFTEGATTASDEVRPPVFSEDLGLAVEQLRPGFTISDLWNIYVE